MFVGQVHKPSTPTLYHHISNKFFNKSYKALAMLAMAAKRDTKKKNAFFRGSKSLKQVIKAFEKGCFDCQDGPRKPSMETPLKKMFRQRFQPSKKVFYFY